MNIFKKMLAFLLCGMLLLCGTACGQNAETETTPSQNISQNMVETPAERLNAVWQQFPEEQKFPIVGGDFSEENNNPDGAGMYDITDAEALDATLVFPAAAVSHLESAASLVHMMNLNTFTGAAFRVKESESIKETIDLLVENVENRQWVCGIPDKFVVFTIGQDVVLLLGERELVNEFRDTFILVYPGASKAKDADISF